MLAVAAHDGDERWFADWLRVRIRFWAVRHKIALRVTRYTPIIS